MIHAGLGDGNAYRGQLLSSSAKEQWKGKGFEVFLKVGFILVKVHNPKKYVDIDIYDKFHVVFWFTCRYFKYIFGLLVVFYKEV